MDGLTDYSPASCSVLAGMTRRLRQLNPLFKLFDQLIF